MRIDWCGDVHSHRAKAGVEARANARAQRQPIKGRGGAGGNLAGIDERHDAQVLAQRLEAIAGFHRQFGEAVAAGGNIIGIARANALPFAFQAAVFTTSLETALRAYARLDATAVMVNDHTAFRVDWMPFAGAKQSGLGVGGIPFTMHEMQTEKMMVLRSAQL